MRPRRTRRYAVVCTSSLTLASREVADGEDMHDETLPQHIVLLRSCAAEKVIEQGRLGAGVRG